MDHDEAVADAAARETDETVDPALLRDVFGERADLAVRYHDLLATTGLEWGLLGPREAERLWSRHVLNSAVLAPLMPPGASVIDVGSGAGLPGIPLALARVDLRVTMLDSLLRRVSFLQLAVDELGLGGRVDVVRARAEEWHVQYDVVVSRAVAPLRRLIQWCEPLMAGPMMALKGEGAEREVQEAGAVLRQLHLEARVLTLPEGATEPSATVVVVKRR